MNSDKKNILSVEELSVTIKELQESLRISDERFDNFMKQIREMVWLIDEMGNIRYVSESVSKILGYCPDELIGQKIFGYLHPDDLDSAMTEYKETLEKRNPHKPTGSRFKHKNEDYIYCDVVAENLLDNQSINGIILTTYDISWRWKAENELRDSEERFRRLSDATFEGIAIIENGKVIDANEQLAALFGYKRNIIIGMSPLEMVSEESKTLVSDAILHGLENPYEIIGIKSDGSKFPLEIHARNFYQKDRMLRMVAIRDLSLIKEAMETILRSESKLRKIFNSTSDGILISNLQHQCLEANDTLLQLIKMSREEILRFRTLDFANENDKQQIIERLKKMEGGENPGSVELELHSPIQNYCFPAEINSRLTKWGDIPVILTVIRDISERKNMERMLFDTIIQTEEMERGRIAEDLHDEIGPLLSSMSLYITSALETDNPQNQQKALLNLKDIVKDTITSVREISGALSPRILVNKGLSSAVETFLEQCKEFIPIEYTSQTADSRFPPNVEIVFYRIIRELVNNTIRHANAEKAQVKLFVNETDLRLEYADNGKGFDLKKILSDPSKGMGIQNIISRCKAIGGTCQMYSEPGFGFSCVLTGRII